jgi:hypothetical protein
MSKRISLEHMARMILERKMKGPETDMNDQIAVGSYSTKAFEMSNPAQKLYSNLPKNTDSKAAEAAAIHMDKLFDIEKATQVRGKSTKSEVENAQDLVKKIKDQAEKMGLSKQHEFINDNLRNIEDRMVDDNFIINPKDHKHPLDDSRFKTPEKDFSTDKTNDRDIDNARKFLIRRDIKAQRKLKIIDGD